MKKKVIKQLYYAISTALIVSIISLSFYFYFLFNSQKNAIINTLNSFKDSITQSDFSILTSSLSDISFLFLAQIITFSILSIALALIGTYLFKLYSIQKRDSLIDPLTKIYNRKTIVFGLRKEIKRAERFKHSLSIAVLDIDFFKQYNDKNGHVQGDEALKKFAKILEKNSRDLDLVGRIGGEEFLIVFPETKLSEAKRICERIRKKVEKEKFEGEENLPGENLTTSIGTANLKKDKKSNLTYGSKARKLIDEADKKLYEVKGNKRNAVL